MEVNRPVAPDFNDESNQLEDLLALTKDLLVAMRENPKDKRKSKSEKVKGEKEKEKEKTKERATKPKPKKKQQLEQSIEVSKHYDKAFTDSENLDDIEQQRRMMVLEADKLYLRGVKTAEEKYRKMVFTDEKDRVLSKTDRFVSKAGVSSQDVEVERKRLARLEESARAVTLRANEEVSQRKKFLKSDMAAVKFQALFRGHIGRQKYRLCAKLQQLKEASEDVGEWIEVVDPLTGDRWYVNRTTNKSQWEKPEQMIRAERVRSKEPVLFNEASVESSSKAGSKQPSSVMGSPTRSTAPEGRSKMLSVSMSLPSLPAASIGKRANLASEFAPQQGSSHASGVESPVKKNAASLKREQQEFENAAAHEVDGILGIDKVTTEDKLLAPTGAFKSALRTTVQDALLESRFDSVSTTLADPRWFEDEDEHMNKKKVSSKVLAGIPEAAGQKDPSRGNMVAVVNFNKRVPKKGSAIESTDPTFAYGSASDIPDTDALTFKEVEHSGFESTMTVADQHICFGCWSSGTNRKCELHSDGAKIKASQTMLLCRNWDLNVMRRRYRSEEIQEVFTQKDTSLRFDPKHKKFSTVQEQRHPIYRMLNERLMHFNNRMVLFEKVKRWLTSLNDATMSSHYVDREGPAFQSAKLLRVQRGMVNSNRVQIFTKTNQALLPMAPLTGSSWGERTGKEQYLFKHFDMASGQDVDLIHIYPIPVPKQLYLPRVYHITVPKSIPMPQPSYRNVSAGGADVQVSSVNQHMDETHLLAWMERMSISIVRDVVNAAKTQIKAVTPVAQVELMERTKRPIPTTIKFATIGQKPTPGNLAVGGLALDLLVNQLINTYFPAVYGNFMVMDKSTVSPGVSAEIMISFQSLVMAPFIQPYIHRALEHPLNYRKAPTITLNSTVAAEARHVYGVNRPEQTGEQESHGFRTTAWAPQLLTYGETDPQVFIPGQGIVSLNMTKANVSFTTHADHTYPFCEPSTRDNSTLDFYHLLLTGVTSFSKSQVFTALTVQEPGTFLKNYRSDLPMGHLVVSVYRSWAFTQTDTIQEFKTDDGVSYWYHRKTGQTFWERPLYSDEEVSPLLGGTELDTIHGEEPSTLARGNEGAQRRYLQGQFRGQMLMHIETKKDALNRRKSANASVKNARLRGVLPDIPMLASIANNVDSTVDMGSRFDITGPQNSSLQNETSFNPDATMNMPSLLLRPGGTPMASTMQHASQEEPQLYGSHVHTHSVQFEDQGAAGHHKATPSSRTGHTPTHSQSQYMPAHGGGGVPPGHPVIGSRLDDGSMFHHNSAMDPYGGGGGGTQSMSRMGGTGGQSGSAMPAPMIPGMDPALMANLSNTIGAMMAGMMTMDRTNPQDMIQFGLGMGMALMSTGAVGGLVNNQLYPPEAAHQSGSHAMDSRGMDAAASGFIPSFTEEEASQISADSQSQSEMSRVSTSKHVSIGGGQREPIGKARPTQIFSADKVLDHTEEGDQAIAVATRMAEPLNTLEHARNLRIHDAKVSDTPDVAPPKPLTVEVPSNAEAGLRESNAMPLVAYPELSTRVEGGAHTPYTINPPAGLGTSFVSKEEEKTQLTIRETNLRRAVMPLPVGFFEAIEAKHLAKQVVDYLPQVPNLPQSRTIGRVKPRSAAADWLMISFDPWSAGKNPLGTEFVPSLMAKADKLIGGAKAADAIDTMRAGTMTGAFVNVDDDEGIAEQRNEISKAQHLAEDFKKLCSLCRHSKFSDAEQLINQPEWSVPIDYQDDQGNTLLHVVAQNGNRRLVKLCLRRGADLNLQNLTGQTALHFAFGYGYAEVGNYLVGKGADDSIRNKDGLTCYEGLAGKELSLL